MSDPTTAPLTSVRPAPLKLELPDPADKSRTKSYYFGVFSLLDLRDIQEFINRSCRHPLEILRDYAQGLPDAVLTKLAEQAYEDAGPNWRPPYLSEPRAAAFLSSPSAMYEIVTRALRNAQPGIADDEVEHVARSLAASDQEIGRIMTAIMGVGPLPKDENPALAPPS